MERHIRLEGVENFRDFGDYPTRDGRRVKRGVLYRSAHHHYATEADLEVISSLGVTRVIDLRRKDERDREPSRRWDSFAAEVIENDLGHAPGDPWFEKIKTAPLTPQWFHDDGVKFYRATPFEERHIDLFARYFQALAQAEGAVVVHCAAGKDRTGMICALTHHLLGVSEADMIEDFLLTNDEQRVSVRSQFLQGLVMREIDVYLPDDAARVAVGVHADYLANAFEAMTERYGSVDAYLEQVLGVDAALREALEARLLE
jgi:protein tyrosine/serine phosphatase